MTLDHDKMKTRSLLYHINMSLAGNALASLSNGDSK